MTRKNSVLIVSVATVRLKDSDIKKLEMCRQRLNYLYLFIKKRTKYLNLVLAVNMSDPRFNNFKIGGYMYDCLFVMYVHRPLHQLTVERCCKLCFYLKQYTTASGGPTAPNQVMVDVLWISRKYSNYDASI